MNTKKIVQDILNEMNDNTVDSERNFKKWFGNSKVVYNGKPLEVYHGSRAYFEEFRGTNYFTDDWWNADGYASGENVYSVFLSIKKPLIIDAKDSKWDELSSEYGSSTQEIVGKVDASKYDGIIFINIKDSWIDDADYQEASTVYVTFKPNQIKSTNNDGSWDLNDKNIFS